MSPHHIGRKARVAGLVSGAVVIAALGCKASPTLLPVAPTTARILSVELIGPDTLAPGEAAQFTALVRLADGTTKSLWDGEGTRWVSESSVVTVSPSGIVTAARSGETVVRVELGALRATREVVVVPTGTFRLVGLVSDSEFPQLGVPGALVEALPGPLSTTTDASGRYRLYGVSPQSELRVTAPGYTPVTRSVALGGHSTADVTLPLAGPRPGLVGNYTLEFTFMSNCASIPPQFHRRTYDAVVAQVGPTVDVVLTNPTLRRNSQGKGDRFKGTVVGGVVTFRLDGPYYYYFVNYYPSIADDLGDGTLLSVTGSMSASLVPAGLIGSMRGSFLRWALPSSFRGSCFGDINFALTPK